VRTTGVALGALGFVVIIAGGVFIMLASLGGGESDEPEPIDEIRGALGFGPPTRIPCPSLPTETETTTALLEPMNIGGVSIAVPEGYTLTPWLPEPATYAAGGDFKLPGLVVTVYP
jgi:hypothetical protein